MSIQFCIIMEKILHCDFMKYVILISLAFINLVGVQVVYAHNENVTQIAVIDGGSSGSRLHIYKIKKENGEVQSIDEIWSKSIKPGIASLPLNSSSMNDYLDQLFSGLNFYDYPIYFYTTAGMRVIPKTKQDSYYKLVKNWFSNHSSFELADLKTISGAEEGVFGWLATYYQSKEDHHVSFGVVDVGGVSTQITFPVADGSGFPKEDINEIKLGQQHIYLYSHSFLGVGQSLALGQFLEDKNCFSQGYLLPNNQLATGNEYFCYKDIKKLINGVHQVNKIIPET